MPRLSPDIVVTEEQFHVFPGDLDYGEGDIRDETYGVPDRLVQPVANAILSILNVRGIGPEAVYFSGHDGVEEDPDAAKLAALRIIDREIEDDIVDGSGEDDLIGAALAQTAQAEDARERQLFRQLGEEERPVYSMSGAEHLAAPPESWLNPIHCAAVTATSQVVVYDRSLVEALDHIPNPLEGRAEVVATQAQLEPAVLARIHPNYVGVGTELPEFEQ